jgi:leader peptidase (prepilin peptidase)/N-methyltransferase
MLERSWRNEAIEILSDEVNLVQDHAVFNLLHPHSHCPQCQAKVPAWTNIPILGYFLIRGKCVKCKQPVSLRYPLIELLTGILFMAVGLVLSEPWSILGGLIFVSVMLCLIMIDFDTFLLPDELTLALLWLGLLFNLHGSISGALHNSVIGAVVGYGFLWGIYWVFKLITHKEGMGYGDFKLLAALGAWLGWQNLVSVLLISSCLGIIYALFLRLSGRLAKGNPIPFGPFLGGAGIITLLFANYLFPIMLY